MGDNPFVRLYDSLRVTGGRMDGWLNFRFWPKIVLERNYKEGELIAPGSCDIHPDALERLLRDLASFLGYDVDWNAAREANHERHLKEMDRRP